MAPSTGEVSNLATASCIAGLLSLIAFVVAAPQFVFLIGSIAIVSGHIARKRIRENSKTTLGSSMALTGLILGYIFVCITLLSLHDSERFLNRAKSVTTLATATALETAVNNFFTEYDKLPNVENRVTTNSSQGVELLKILLGLEPASSSPQNNRQIKFLSVREGKNRKNGLVYSPSGDSVEGLFDSWGNPYTVILDSDNDEILRFKIATKDIELKGRRVAVFTSGPDKKEGTGDDIRTW
jgi:hypothetical protein